MVKCEHRIVNGRNGAGVFSTSAETLSFCIEVSILSDQSVVCSGFTSSLCRSSLISLEASPEELPKVPATRN